MGPTHGISRRRNLLHRLNARAASSRPSHGRQAVSDETRLRRTLASIADGVITCDPDGYVQTINAAAIELTRYTAEQALHRPLSEILTLVSEETGEPLEDPVSCAKRTGSVVILSSGTWLTRGENGRILIEGSAAPIRGQAERLFGFVFLFRDVTERRGSEAARLANAKLGAAGHLAATLAHELHNPLDSVSNLLYLLGSDLPEGELPKLVRMGQGEIARAIKISHAMLSLYRASHDPVEIDVGNMLEAVANQTAEQRSGRGGTLATTLAKNLRIFGFPDELRKVFTCLLTNAAEAGGPAGSITLTAHSGMRARATFESGQPRLKPMIVITVTDDGPGIAPDIHEQIFKPFFSTKEERGGGLGLWISQNIIIKHGGEISIDTDTSPQHHGTTVRVSLPAAPPTHPVLPTP